MDIQDNILISINSYDFYINLNKITYRNILFEFEENNDVYLTFDSQNYSVSIERGEKNSNSDIKYLYELKNQETIKLNSHDDSFYPSIYLIIIKNKHTDEIFYKHFRVKPLTSLSQNDMFDDMRKIISSYSKSFLYDYSKEKYVNILEKELNTYSLVNVCNYLNSNYHLILRSLINCEKNPIVVLNKELIKTDIIKKQNAKCIMKLIKNDQKYTLKTKEIYSGTENFTLKFYLKESEINLILLCEKIQNFIDCYRNNLKSYDKVYLKADFKLKERLENEIKLIKDKIKLFEDSTLIINNLILKIDELLYNSFLSRINTGIIKITDKFLKNFDYNMVYKKLYLPLIKNDNEVDDMAINTKHIGYSYKSTSSLYEIYCLLFIIRIIENNDFIIDPTEESFDILGLELIDSNIVFNYTNGINKLKLIYDKKILDVENQNEKELININSIHDKPDFQILYFDKDDNLLSSIIMDSKCRRFEYIKIGENENITKTVNDYMQFRYAKKNQKLINSINAVSNIVLLCPDINLKETYIDDKYGIIYFPLRPENGIKKENVFEEFNLIFKNIIFNKGDDLND